MKTTPKKALLKAIASGKADRQTIQRSCAKPDLSILTVEELRLLRRFIRNNNGTQVHTFTDEERTELQLIEDKLFRTTHEKA